MKWLISKDRVTIILICNKRLTVGFMVISQAPGSGMSRTLAGVAARVFGPMGGVSTIATYVLEAHTANFIQIVTLVVA